MKSFLIKIVLFLLPVLAFYSFPIAIMFLSREYYTAADVVALQAAGKNRLYGNVYNMGSFIPYKVLLTQAMDPDVMALGTSRALQIRKEFFVASSTFVNAGLAGRSVGDMQYFIESLRTESRPRALMLVIDRDTFLRKPGAADIRTDDYSSVAGFNFSFPLDTARGVYLDYFARHKYSLASLLESSGSSELIGIRAFGDGNGFRPDGSYRNYKESQDRGLAERTKAEVGVVADNIRQKKDSYSSGNENMAPNLEVFSKAVSLARQKGISVVGIIPPYPSRINEATFSKDSADRDRDILLTDSVSSIMKENGFAFHDLSDISKYGGSDAEFMDTIHGTDLIYARLCEYLAIHDKTLSAYLDAKAIRDLISKASGNFLSM